MPFFPQGNNTLLALYSWTADSADAILLIQPSPPCLEGFEVPTERVLTLGGSIRHPPVYMNANLSA